MTHRFPIKLIAAQAGLGTATVDRVLNDRANVSVQTRMRVHAAIAELVQQEQQVSSRGRRMFFDVVVEAPERFAREVRHAVEHVLPSFAPLNLRARFAGAEVLTGAQILAILARIAKRGSDGIILKARDIPDVRDGIAMLRAKGIPVVTFVTDVPATDRIAYAGLDNAQAGRTAAGLIKREVFKGQILGTISNQAFEGEDARWAAFSAELSDLFDLHLIRDFGGLNTDASSAVRKVLTAGLRPIAVYSMSGGNRAIRAALDDHGVAPSLYIAHDLDSDNVCLLRSGEISHVLYHDLADDMAQVFRQLCGFHRAVSAAPAANMSDVQIVMRSNIPKRFQANKNAARRRSFE